MATSKLSSKSSTLTTKPQSSLLKLLGFILLMGTITLITFQSAMLAISGWS